MIKFLLNTTMTDQIKTENNQWQEDLYLGLQALADSAFPKQCKDCDRIYETAEDFIRRTINLQDETSGLQQAAFDSSVIVELYRNCECGSTLLDFFTDRRDISSYGLERRIKFGELLIKLTEMGIPSVDAQVEMIKVLRGEDSDLLKNIHKQSY